MLLLTAVLSSYLSPIFAVLSFFLHRQAIIPYKVITSATPVRTAVMKRPGAKPTIFRSQKLIKVPYAYTEKAPVPDRNKFFLDMKKMSAPDST